MSTKHDTTKQSQLDAQQVEYPHYSVEMRWDPRDNIYVVSLPE